MSDEYLDETNLEISEEYEEISSDEVDRVIEALDELAEGIDSENIKASLEAVTQQIYELVYEDDDDDDDDEIDDVDDLDEDDDFDDDELLADEEELSDAA